EGAFTVSIGTGFLGAGTQRYIDGTLDEVGIWDRALSDDEIVALFEGASPIASGDPALVTTSKSSLGQVTSVPPTHRGSFQIRNLGETQDLTISGITVSGANADRFTVDSFPATIAPGETGEVVYTFDSKGESGGFVAELEITSNAEEDPVRTVEVSAAVINLQGPVAHYHLDEGSPEDPVRDASGRERDGSYAAKGGAISPGEAALAGTAGTAVRLEGGADISIPVSVFDGFDPISVSMWIQPDEVANLQTLVAKGAQTPDFAVLLGGGALNWFVAGESQATSDVGLTSGSKHHVVMTFEAAELAMYVDGSEVLRQADPEPVADNGEGVLAFGSVSGQLPYAGLIDEIQVYSRALPAEDVLTLFNNPESTLGDLVAVDSDGDGLSDEEEVEAGTDPLVPDTDGDLLSDGDEVTRGTDPLEKDTDQGGAWDGLEVQVGSDPSDGSDDPAVWTVRTLKSGGTLSTLTDADAMIADASWTSEISRQHRQINFQGTGGNGGNFGDNDPFDNISAIEASDINDFAVVATTRIFTDQSGVYTFGFNSDDGGRLAIDGVEVAVFPGTRGEGDSLGVVSLCEGFHEVEVTYFERGGGSALEVFHDPDAGDSSAGFDGNRHVLLEGTAVVPVDADGDQLDDNWESAVFGDLAQDGSGDADADGLSDLGEHDAATCATEADTDEDGLMDGVEVNEAGTHPLVADTDGDGRSDGEEVNGNPTSNPLVEDTDGDGFRDGFEVTQGSDPGDAASLPADTLGEPDRVWTVLEGLPTFDNIGGNEDKLDVSFRVCIDFQPQTNADTREMIWESGGGTVGFSLVYENNSTLVLRAAGNGGNTVVTVEHALTAGQLSAGSIPVVWTFDVDNEDAVTGQTIALWVDGEKVGEEAGDMDPDWTGSNGASFGAASTSFAAGGGNTALGDSLDFESGTIDLEKGLQMFVDALFSGGGGPPALDPTADDDGDGITNGEEEIAGTDPMDAGSFLRITELVATADGPQIRWASVAGRTYHVQYAEVIAPDAWERIVEIPATGTVTEFQDADMVRRSAGTGFYRIEVVR
ncbi:MAG: LamG-like jellyroll fold domain-containing protein, partial [Verrucomicrobiota bacterium]